MQLERGVLIFLILVSSGCATNPLDNYPERGFKMYESTREFGGPGVVIKRNIGTGENDPFGDTLCGPGVDCKIVKEEETLFDKEERKEIRLGIDTLLDFMTKGFASVSADVGFFRSTTMHFEASGAFRHGLSIPDIARREYINKYKKDHEEKDRESWDSKEYFLVSQAISVEKVKFSFELTDKTKAAVQAKEAELSKKGVIIDYGLDNHTKIGLEKTYSNPEFIFYAPEPIREHSWLYECNYNWGNRIGCTKEGLKYVAYLALIVGALSEASCQYDKKLPTCWRKESPGSISITWR